MRRVVLASLVIALVALTTVTAFPCGDKLVLIPGFGRLRQVNGGARPAAVLAYAPEDSPLTAALRNLQSQTALKRAGGYQVHIVEDSSELTEALQTGNYDLLLVDAAHAEEVEPQAQAAPSKPTLLPVLYKSTKAEAKLVEKRFHSVLRAPASPGNYVAAFDDAIALREKTVKYQKAH